MYLRYPTREIAARMEMITTTIINSTNVIPRAPRVDLRMTICSHCRPRHGGNPTRKIGTVENGDPNVGNPSPGW